MTKPRIVLHKTHDSTGKTVRAWCCYGGGYAAWAMNPRSAWLGWVDHVQYMKGVNVALPVGCARL